MDILKNYIEGFSGRKVYFIGAGVSHRRLIACFAGHGADVTVCDRLPRDRFDRELYDALTAVGVKFVLGDEYLDRLADADVIFRSPGISPNHPKLAAAVAAGAELTSEMQGFFEVCPCRIIGITGSDGKTTTSTLISEMLKHAGYRVHLGGNIGVPLLPDVDAIGANDMAVVELSSFQLMSMTRSPDVALVTNIAPNHLDYHTDMAEYIDAKTNIFRFQKPGMRAVVNVDDPEVVRMAQSSAAEKVFFSAKDAPERGAYVRNSSEIVAFGAEIARLSELRLRGFHNAINLAAACAAVYPLVSFEDMRAVAESFSGVEHRIEFVRELDGVSFYNDSIATTPTRTIAGLRAFDRRVILIAGGYDKHLSFEPMAADVAQRTRLLILCGATADRIEATMDEYGYDRGELEILRVENLAQAVKTAAAKATAGDVVLFSPACASFDSFTNFEQRGEYFKKLTWAL